MSRKTKPKTPSKVMVVSYAAEFPFEGDEQLAVAQLYRLVPLGVNVEEEGFKMNLSLASVERKWDEPDGF